MTARDKDKVRILINEAMAWADNEHEVLFGLDGDCEEINIPALTIPQVKMLLEQLKTRLLKDDESPSQNDAQRHLRECPNCHGKKVLPVVKHGDWGYYPASAYIECEDCGLKSKEFEGKDDSDESGALRKAILAWNRRC